MFWDTLLFEYSPVNCCHKLWQKVINSIYKLIYWKTPLSHNVNESNLHTNPFFITRVLSWILNRQALLLHLINETILLQCKVKNAIDLSAKLAWRWISAKPVTRIIFPSKWFKYDFSSYFAWVIGAYLVFRLLANNHYFRNPLELQPCA